MRDDVEVADISCRENEEREAPRETDLANLIFLEHLGIM
jgi:hypothetical protein